MIAFCIFLFSTPEDGDVRERIEINDIWRRWGGKEQMASCSNIITEKTYD